MRAPVAEKDGAPFEVQVLQQDSGQAAALRVLKEAWGYLLRLQEAHQVHPPQAQTLVVPQEEWAQALEEERQLAEHAHERSCAVWGMVLGGELQQQSAALQDPAPSQES